MTPQAWTARLQNCDPQKVGVLAKSETTLKQPNPLFIVQLEEESQAPLNFLSLEKELFFLLSEKDEQVCV